jgi:hypothetical protein
VCVCVCVFNCVRSKNLNNKAAYVRVGLYSHTTIETGYFSTPFISLFLTDRDRYIVRTLPLSRITCYKAYHTFKAHRTTVTKNCQRM